jgi:hypothetical protein
MSGKWLVEFNIPWEVNKEERLKNAIEEFNNRNLNEINIYGREIKEISNK